MLRQIGRYSVLIGCIGSLWGLFMIIVLCLPQAYPYTTINFNYSPHMLGSILIYALLSWFYSARRWFKCTIVNQELMGEINFGSVVEQSSVDHRVTDAESSEEMVVFSPMSFPISGI